MRGVVVLWPFRERKGEGRQEVARAHTRRRCCPIRLSERDEGWSTDRAGPSVSEGGEGEVRWAGGGWGEEGKAGWKEKWAAAWPNLEPARIQKKFFSNFNRFRIWQEFRKLHKEI
jgi:hypothetical protein